MDFDNEISSDDPEATAAANSIAAAVAGGSSRRSSQKSRSSRWVKPLEFSNVFILSFFWSQVFDFQ